MSTQKNEKTKSPSRIGCFIFFVIFIVVVIFVSAYAVTFYRPYIDRFFKQNQVTISVAPTQANIIVGPSPTAIQAKTLPPIWTPTSVVLVPTMTLLPSSTPIPTSTLFVVKIPKQNYSVPQGSVVIPGQSCPSASDQSWHDYMIQEINSIYKSAEDQYRFDMRMAMLNGDSLSVLYIKNDFNQATAEYQSSLANENARFANLCK